MAGNDDGAKGDSVKSNYTSECSECESSEEEQPVEIPDNVAYDPPAPMCSFYYAVRCAMSSAMYNFFSEISVLGLHNVPKRGPVIFCGNHAN